MLTFCFCRVKLIFCDDKHPVSEAAASLCFSGFINDIFDSFSDPCKLLIKPPRAEPEINFDHQCFLQLFFVYNHS